MKVTHKMFLHCSICNKKLIERLPNGLFRFIFGGMKKNDDDTLKHPPVDMYIHGSVKMRCTRRSCGEYNILNFFPPSFIQSGKPELNIKPTKKLNNDNDKKED